MQVLFSLCVLKRAFVVCTCLFAIACSRYENEVTIVQTRPELPVLPISPGKHELNLGSTLFINRGFYWRDGYIYVPKRYQPAEPIPLIIWLHGGGGSSADADHMLSIADQYNLAILSLDARHNTWDGIDSPIGPDVIFIDKSLDYVFDRVNIDPSKIALGGLSDGGTYSIAIGRSNGDLFTHIIAVAPWRMKPPSEPKGKPDIFLAHGTRDFVYPIAHTRYFLYPDLQKEGYDVEFLEFDGPHWATPPVVHRFMQWLLSEE